VIAELRRFRAFEIDLTNALDHKELRERYKVAGPPAYFIFDSEGSLLHSLTYDDLKEVGPFLTLLQNVE
jgi:hypothetical protein